MIHRVKAERKGDDFADEMYARALAAKTSTAKAEVALTRALAAKAAQRGAVSNEVYGAELSWQSWQICIFFFKFCKFLAGSFSAVSKPNFATKYAFDSIFQALQDLHPFAPLQSQNFRKKSV